ncbi:ArsR/SmtB family transcription factor [Massilia antarctica]|uniref:ArsR/SmtB family transcription factor n=1 Tax=Massilia antarctica TaxID=2765360 RepID=UPI001E3A675D|nr:metalloregulator ArsR/SmtB family transcription factor [Massilia sp. H27-R4]MCY0910627.1 metalloregulator ArsR/SmtB family transcription factor [Massilia sp. H27-R4]
METVLLPRLHIDPAARGPSDPVQRSRGADIGVTAGWFKTNTTVAAVYQSGAAPGRGIALPGGRAAAEKPLDHLSCVRYSLQVKENKPLIDGDQLLAILSALANPHRLRIIAALASGGRNYVSQLARDIGISRPLLHLHLQKLEQAGLVTSRLELSHDGKALNYFEAAAFAVALTPEAIAEAVKSLTTNLEK